ncbi:MAG: SpoIID/LytB domain-containing protein [Candidatus Omnitrophota bacterium]|nr:MAG: SpoIID/LytB domain-containing protein [Candidatus Omnitrophota bacterium]
MRKKSKVEEWLDVATIFKENMEYKKAKAVLESALEESTDERLVRMLARLYCLDGNSKKGLRVFGSLTNKGWQDFLYMGLIYEDLGEINSAIENFAKSVESQKNTIALYRLGKIFYQRGEYKNAKRYFSELISFDPSYRLPHYYLGQCLSRLGHFTESHRYLSKAAHFYPQQEKIEKQLAFVKAKLGENFFAQKTKKVEEERKRVKLAAYKSQLQKPVARVGIGKGLKKFTFRCGSPFVFTDGKKVFRGDANKSYTVNFKDTKFSLSDYTKKRRYGIFQGTITIFSQSKESDGQKYPFYVFDVTYGQGRFWHKKIDRAYRGDLEIMPNANRMTLVNVIGIEEYLFGVLPAEILSSSPFAALKAQALAARTIAYRGIGRHRKEGFDFCADVHCQVYQGMSTETSTTTKAVKETAGEVLIFNERPVEAFYHSNCGGCLRSDSFAENSCFLNKFDAMRSRLNKHNPYTYSPYEEEVWFSAKPKAFCSSGIRSNFRWQRVYDQEDFVIIFGFKLEDFRVLPLKKGDCFHYDSVEVNTPQGKSTLKGDYKIREYFDRLRSSAFKMEVKFSSKRKPQLLLFWGAGFGHGIGLCQEGAVQMARDGHSYEEILKHYYPQAELKKGF